MGETPVVTAKAPSPKSHRKLYIGGAAAAAVVIAVASVLAVNADSILDQKPDAETIATNYLQALSAGDGDAAFKFIDSTSDLLSPEAASTLGEATSHIQDVKVGEDAGSMPKIDEGKAEIPASYSLAGKQLTTTLNLVKGESGWTIQDPDTTTIFVPVQELDTAGDQSQTTLDFTATVGSTLILEPGQDATLLPAEYPLTYNGNKNFKFDVESFSENLNSDFLVLDMDSVAASLEPIMTDYLSDCMDTGQTQPLLDEEQPCGFSSVGFPATLSKGVQTDTTEWALTSPPAMTFEPDTQYWAVSFATSVHRVRTHMEDVTEEDLTPEFHCGGSWIFNDAVVPVFSDGYCDPIENLGYGNGQMYALTMDPSAAG